MEFCSICTTSFDSGDRRIRCSGQRCNRTFHTRCARLADDIVCTWLDDDVGLFWFCPSCRMVFVPMANSSRKGGKHKLEEDEERGEASAAKRIRKDPSPRLPPEVWTMIFEHLDSRWLARARLVCRDWNEMVTDRSNLMDRFLLRLNERQLVDDTEELRHFLALRVGFTRAEFDFNRIRKDKPRVVWFATIGKTLTTLTCKWIPFGFLYELLRTLPNLKRLSLINCFAYGKSVKLNYQLMKLEELSIAHFYNKHRGHAIFPALQHICPRITVLELSVGEYDKFSQDIRRFVSKVQDTLQYLNMSGACSSSKVMDELVKINGLKLKRIDIDCSEQDLVRLLRRQPTVERLYFHGQVTNVSTLGEIALNLPNLKQIKLSKIKLEQTSSSKLLNYSRAEFIEVRHCGSSDGVSGLAHCQSSSLQRLEIYGAYLPGEALISLPQIAKQLKSVSFSSCTVERSSDIVSFVQQLKSFATLMISQLQVKTKNDMPDTGYEKSETRHLKLVDHGSSELLHALVEICPQLESIDIEQQLTAADMIRIGQRLQRLKSLTLRACDRFRYHSDHTYKKVSLECLRPITIYFKTLKNLRIMDWQTQQETFLDALQGLRKDIEVSFPLN